MERVSETRKLGASVRDPAAVLVRAVFVIGILFGFTVAVAGYAGLAKRLHPIAPNPDRAGIGVAEHRCRCR